ncbi:hypothetical protein [Bacillus thuringiensis]|uniref:hypothetical protein n=1 Tax=Bacillus thuringiensis TaxID=1428 RepID=UPI000A39F056|nr:hypothetical protein [Bacillus thuringiensis]OTZ47978.1 hypothetical protein BK762_20045 [Bacillus thuringiensis serovar toumanoffi]
MPTLMTRPKPERTVFNTKLPVGDLIYMLLLNDEPYGSGTMDYMQELIADRLKWFPDRGDTFRVVNKRDYKDGRYDEK